MGPDGVYPRVLKELDDIIAKPFSMIFQQPWEFGEVPPNCKLANTLIFKKGKNEKPRKYRPVSLTLVPEEVMKKVIIGGAKGCSEGDDIRLVTCPIFVPVLVNIFINELGTRLEVILSKITNNSKLEGAVDSLKGLEALQRDLNKLGNLAIINGMKFNKGKCWILHLGWATLDVWTDWGTRG
ncbi:hypothetical protein DUI87_23030 [Hirundo rustica rustica]|uniref:Reverse transcriptase domain-containing protein n=1 Tax=Hirundo rustica rustica TaxID=333673 RepID=A0A3M0JH64_HIRRU|nr:hypothetical protein DUI87_23030 [Hirundo rustica rustica]